MSSSTSASTSSQTIPASLLEHEQPLPQKRIAGDVDIDAWESSEAYSRLARFISALVSAMTGHSLSEPTSSSSSEPRHPMLSRLVGILEQIDGWIDEIPLRVDPQRFGNLAFRDWGNKLEEQAEELHRDVVPLSCIGIKAELIHHFKTSFGSFTRIDYGSGHELSFLAYLSLFYLSGLLPSGSERSLVTSVFVKYLRVCHRLQTTYRLEPAGSKGVWGLDDYKFVPFILGAAQLLPPCAKAPPVKRILDVRDEEAPLARDNLLFMSVAQIHSIKRGPFHEHSPVLYNIAATVPNWSKVCSGLQKMFANEVLHKWPVVQHFYFGACLPWTSHATGQPLPSSAGSSDSSQQSEAQRGSLPGATMAPWAMKQDTQPTRSIAQTRIPNLEGGPPL